MPDRHETPALPAPLLTEVSENELRVGLPGGPPATFKLVRVRSLTRQAVADVLNRADLTSQQRVFVFYRQGTAESRSALRAAGISFAGEDGRVFIDAPGIFVELDRGARPHPLESWETAGSAGESARNPFSKRSSRVPRWLLLHHAESFSPSKLAHAVDLNPAAVSRVLRSLEDAVFVREAQSHAGGRRRNVRLERPRALLEAWLPLWQRRRIRQRHWDIGARDIGEALGRLGEAVEDRHKGWAIGGLTGAALLRRSVEPADVLVWTTAEEMEAMAHILRPERAQGGRGVVRVAIAPDPWTLGLAQLVDGFPVADPVGLWLDCAAEGERALEAAEAVAQMAGWS